MMLFSASSFSAPTETEMQRRVKNGVLLWGWGELEATVSTKDVTSGGSEDPVIKPQNPKDDQK